MLSKQNQKKLEKIIKKYNFTQKSPYSESYYTDGLITWGSKPEGSLRLSDHWNFESRGEIHCKTTCGTKQGWYIGRYENGVYTLIEKVFNDDEEALEMRMKERLLKNAEEKRNKLLKIEQKKNKMLEKGGNYLVRYTTSKKHGRYFTTKSHEEVCYCKGCWAYTSNGRKRVFELVLN